ncbi:MAG: hypothetical protein ACFFDF_04550 [Candidatus Odinarchaeota archaeon]
MTHRESKPWIAIWYLPHCGVALYEESPGVWTAVNQRKIIVLPFFLVYEMWVFVHFVEETMTFYYSVYAWDNAVAVISAWFEVLKGWG